MSLQFIDTPEALQTLCDALSSSQWLAVDTEFLREKTYYPQLCLIQVANADIIACVDPLAIDDLSPLLDLFYRDDITLVFHAARQDLELFYLLNDNPPPHVFDTQLAATILGYGEQIGYANLVKQLLNIDLDKTHTRTDWSQRPLSTAQLDYAAADVDHLRFVYEKLLDQLTETNRLTWLDNDFATLSSIKTYQEDVNQSWQRIRGAGKLKTNQLAVLQQLALWREQKAIQMNKPRRWILKDDAILDLARFSPDSIQAMHKIRSLEDRDVSRHGKDLLATITAGKATPKEQWPTLKKVSPLTHQQEALVDALMALLRHCCDEKNITPTAVATRKSIEALVRNESTSLLEGWRYEIAGQALQKFLDGNLTITASSTQLIIQ